MIIIVSSDHAAESVKEKEKARPEIQTIIENFFGGRLQITVRCHSCSKDSVREDYFTHLGWNREILELGSNFGSNDGENKFGSGVYHL